MHNCLLNNLRIIVHNNGVAYVKRDGDPDYTFRPLSLLGHTVLQELQTQTDNPEIHAVLQAAIDQIPSQPYSVQ